MAFNIRLDKDFFNIPASVIVHKRGDVAVAIDGYTKQKIAEGTDHASVLQEALNALQNKGGAIFIKKGDYAISREIYPPRDVPIFVRSDGARLYATKDVSGIFSFKGSGDDYNPYVYRFSIEGLELDGNNKALWCIVGASSAVVSGVWLNNKMWNTPVGRMVVQIKTWRFQAIGNYFSNRSTGDIFGIDPLEGTVIAYNVFEKTEGGGNALGTGGATPALIDDKEREMECTVIGNVFRGIDMDNRTMLRLEQGYDKEIKRYRIIGNHLVYADISILTVNWDKTKDTYDVIISDNYLYGGYIRIATFCKRIVVKNNIIKDSPIAGIYTYSNINYGYIDDLVIEGNVIENTNMKNDSSYYDKVPIVIHGSVRSAIIKNCIIRRTENLTYGTPSFLYIGHSGDVDVGGRIIVEGLQFQGTPSQTKPIVVYNDGYLPYTYIRNCENVDVTVSGTYMDWKERIKLKFNRGYVTENYGVAVFSGDGSTTQFKIEHGLSRAPSKVLVTPASADAVGDFYVTWDGTYIYINYSTAPPSGTDNVKLAWQAEC